MSLFSRIVLPSARVNPRTSQRLCRSFTSSVLCLNRYERSPQTRNRSQQQRSEEEHYDQYEQPYRRPSRFNKGNIIVGGIIGVCVGVFAYGGYLRAQVGTNFSNKTLANFQWFKKNFEMSYEGINNGRYYTMLTSALNHENLLHIGFNMFALWGFGQNVINLFGVPAFGILFVGSALTGGVAQYYFWKKKKEYHVSAVGASGAVFGIFSALTFVMPRSPVLLAGVIPIQMWSALGISVAASVAGLQGQWGPSFGHADHLGGMAFGALFWLLALRKRPGGYMPHYR